MSNFRRPIQHRHFWGLICGLAVLSVIGVRGVAEAQPAAEPESESEQRPAHLITVPLPITGTIDTQVKRQISTLLAESDSGGPRPILILEFRTKDEQTGASSEFERSLSLARFLASDRLSGTRTVAYLPTSVKGHAVLPVLACEEIIIDPDAEFGAAGVAEPYIDPTVRRGYSETAERRRTVPVAVALGMLDKELSVYQVQTVDGVRYVLEQELEELKQSTTVSSIQSIIPPGDMGLFTGRELRLKYGFASHLASDRRELAAALSIPPAAIQQDPSLDGQWRPIRIDVSGPVNAKAVNWTLRSLREQLTDDRVNFLCVVVDSAGGSAEDSLRLASYLADLDATRVRTVAFVPAQARGDAALIALACDQLVMSETAILGGPGEAEVSSRDVPQLRQAIQAVARAKGRDWSLPVALVDSSLTVHRFTREGSGEVRVLSAAELSSMEDPEAWKQGSEVVAREGLTGREAESLGLVSHLAGDFAEFRRVYQLEDNLEFLQPNWAHMFVERLASPRLAGILLFVAWFTMMVEFAQPGLGIAGFISAVCFVLFFWSNYLHGTAGWLEVMLFVTGVFAVILEIFVLPGFGIFGFGGAVLIVGSIILASQTFVIPRNSYQLDQLPSSLFMVAAAGAGAFVSIAFIRRFLPETPLFRHLMLPTPDEEALDQLHRRESLADFAQLMGKRGQTTTQLTPSGKARFGDEVVNVISAGQLIPSGTDVYVSQVRGNRILVEPIADDF